MKLIKVEYRVDGDEYYRNTLVTVNGRGAISHKISKIEKYFNGKGIIPSVFRFAMKDKIVTYRPIALTAIKIYGQYLKLFSGYTAQHIASKKSKEAAIISCEQIIELALSRKDEDEAWNWQKVIIQINKL